MPWQAAQAQLEGRWPIPRPALLRGCVAGGRESHDYVDDTCVDRRRPGGGCLVGTEMVGGRGFSHRLVAANGKWNFHGTSTRCLPTYMCLPVCTEYKRCRAVESTAAGLLAGWASRT